MNTKRISYIDMAKGIGIILVVFGHFDFVSEPFLTWIMSFHMPLFFILSGMLLSYSNADRYDMSTFLQKKAKNILIPYFSFSFLSIVFSGILDFSTFKTYFPNALIQTFLFYGISVLWFLPALFFGETIFLWIRKHTSLKVTGFLSLCVCLITVFFVNAYHYHYPLDFNNLLSVWGAYLISVFVRTGIAITFLGIGYFVQHFLFQKEYSAPTYLVLTVLLFALNLFLAFKNEKVDLNNLIFNNYLLYFSAAICGSMAVIFLCAALPAWKSLLYIGKNSLIIMATHMNCRFLGICYAIGNLILSIAPGIGSLGYQIIVIVCMIFLEAIAIYSINHYMPFLLGRKKTNTHL